MDSLDKFFKKYSYKFPKGYPDLNNEQDINLLADILENMGIVLQKEQQLDIDFPEDLDGEIKQLTSTLDDKDIKRKIIKILKKANKKEDVYDEDEVKKAKNTIIEELHKKKLKTKYAKDVYKMSLDLNEYKALAKYLENPTVTNIPESGNLLELFSPIPLSETFKKEIIDEAYGRSIGKGEIALITLIGGCTARGGQKVEGKGDIYLNGTPIEVKQGKNFQLVPFEISGYGVKPSSYLEKKTGKEFGSKGRWPDVLQNYWASEDPDKKISTKEINEIIKDLYENYVTPITDEKLKEPNGLLNHIADNLVEKYIGEAKSILFISNTYNFKRINTFEEYKSLKGNNLKISAFSDEFPRFSYS